MRLEYSTDYSAPTDTRDWLNTDAVLVRPISPGAALVRLAQVSGGLSRQTALAALLPAQAQDNLQKHRAALEAALEANQLAQVEATLRETQNELRGLFLSLSQPLLEGEISDEDAATRVAALADLGFPDPRESEVHVVDINTVIPTFSLIRRQVVATINFQDAHNATGYWLHEVRYFGEDERIEDPLLESHAPLFPRVRLALGERHLRIKSRNAHFSAITPEFTIVVPDLTK